MAKRHRYCQVWRICIFIFPIQERNEIADRTTRVFGKDLWSCDLFRPYKSRARIMNEQIIYLFVSTSSWSWLLVSCAVRLAGIAAAWSFRGCDATSSEGLSVSEPFGVITNAFPPVCHTLPSSLNRFVSSVLRLGKPDQGLRYVTMKVVSSHCAITT